MVRKKDERRETVKVTAYSAEFLIKDRPLRFEPPLIERSPNAEAFVFQWRSLQYVFPGLADPRSFPPPPDAPDEDLRLFRRYVAAAEEMAESTLLSADDRMTVRLDDDTDEEHVESVFTSKEVTRGFTTLLRQFDAKDEPASFQRVSGRLRQIAATSADGQADERCRQIDAWRRAQGRLHAFSLPKLVRQKVQRDGIAALDYDDEHPPNYYLSAYNYSDLIHWDSKSDVVAAWETEPFHRDYQRLAFLAAAAGLAHLYIGFGVVVSTALASASGANES